MECLVSDSGATREAGKALLGPFVCCCFLNGPINAHLWSRKVVKESQRSASLLVRNRKREGVASDGREFEECRDRCDFSLLDETPHRVP